MGYGVCEAEAMSDIIMENMGTIDKYEGGH
jgi:hypothetical protein